MMMRALAWAMLVCTLAACTSVSPSAADGGGGSGGNGGAGGTGLAGNSAGAGAGGGGGGGDAGVEDGASPLDCSLLGPQCVQLCEGGACACDCSASAPCPEQRPVAGDACASSPEICTYGDTVMCRSLWECHAGAWVVLADACYGSDDALCPATVTEYMASSCPRQPCIYDDAVMCVCAVPSCSGIQQPEQPTCAAVEPAVCRDALVDGTACAQPGVHCGTHCCGIGWDCTASGWQSADYPCPP